MMRMLLGESDCVIPKCCSVLFPLTASLPQRIGRFGGASAGGFVAFGSGLVVMLDRQESFERIQLGFGIAQANFERSGMRGQSTIELVALGFDLAEFFLERLE